ncbi:hypothetical protein FE257_005403 [Aspergillus nanangensis]|uniref:Uncharacterized protein n=1 Tax=Aspergillus nanangensis TaxID=2582783 RepID=A0AAD4GVH7_ASPNN|nr:hypothetical protein FE257_005403 [Aspergillus nanangensis]
MPLAWDFFNFLFTTAFGMLSGVAILMRELISYQNLFSTWNERPETGKSQVRHKITLESLPADLRIEVLKSLPDFCTLRHLLHASPTYYRTYTSLQQEVLTALVSRQYVQGTAADVVAVHLSSAFFHSDTIRTKQEAISFLDIYRHARGSMSVNPFLTSSAKRETMLTIYDLHNIQECIKVLVQEYHDDLDQSDPARELYREETEKIPLSSLARMRIIRAICRIQIFSNVFYQPRKYSTDPESSRSEYFQLGEAYNLFCATFPPWERDEMWAVYRWFEDLTKRVLDKLDEVDPHGFALDPYYQDYIFVSMCTRGPIFLAKLLLESDLQKRYEVFYNEINFWDWTYSTPSLDDCLLLSPASELLYPADQQVELYKQDMGNRTFLFHLQMPTLGWQECSYDTGDDFAELDQFGKSGRILSIVSLQSDLFPKERPHLCPGAAQVLKPVFIFSWVYWTLVYHWIRTTEQVAGWEFASDLLAALTVTLLLSLAVYVNVTHPVVGKVSTPGFPAIDVNASQWNIACAVLGTAVRILVTGALAYHDGLLTREAILSDQGVVSYLRPLTITRAIAQTKRGWHHTTRMILLIFTIAATLSTTATVAIFGVDNVDELLLNPSASWPLATTLGSAAFFASPETQTDAYTLATLDSFLFKIAYIEALKAKGWYNSEDLKAWLPESGALGDTLYPSLRTGGIGLNTSSYIAYSGHLRNGFNVPATYIFNELHGRVFGTHINVKCTEATHTFKETTAQPEGFSDST